MSNETRDKLADEYCKKSNCPGYEPGSIKWDIFYENMFCDFSRGFDAALKYIQEQPCPKGIFQCGEAKLKLSNVEYPPNPKELNDAFKKMQEQEFPEKEARAESDSNELPDDHWSTPSFIYGAKWMWNYRKEKK